jgi:hypothetical protein
MEALLTGDVIKNNPSFCLKAGIPHLPSSSMLLIDQQLISFDLYKQFARCCRRGVLVGTEIGKQRHTIPFF